MSTIEAKIKCFIENQLELRANALFGEYDEQRGSTYIKNRESIITSKCTKFGYCRNLINPIFVEDRSHGFQEPLG